MFFIKIILVIVSDTVKITFFGIQNLRNRSCGFFAQKDYF